MQKNEKATYRDDVWVYNDGLYEREIICGEKWLRLIYENPASRATLLYLVKRKAASRLYGMYCRTSFSARKIPQFIKRYQVDMTGCDGPYKNYEDFFSREKEGIIFPSEPNILGSPCEAVISAYTDIDASNVVAAKDTYFSLSELFGDETLAKEYEGGTMLRVRLRPTDYHRVHFFDYGVITASKYLNGHLYSVNPIAIKRIARLYCRNKRALVLFSSQNFGDVAMVEIGATFVGSIVHCFEDGDAVKRGQQASFFLPGGSMLLLYFKKGTFTPNELLLKQTADGYETKVNIGEALGIKE
jgi:phosphatidylserine decarboxylase